MVASEKQKMGEKDRLTFQIPEVVDVGVELRCP